MSAQGMAADAGAGAEPAALQALFELDDVGLSQADAATGRLLRVSWGFAGMLGRERADMLGYSFLDFTHANDRARHAEDFRQLVQGELPSLRLEKRFLRGDGTPLWTLMTVNLMRDGAGRPWRTLAVIVDISERRGMEEALARSRERLELALSAAHLGLWEWSFATGRLWVSEEVLRITGLAREQLEREPQAWRRLVHPQDVDVIWAADAGGRQGEAFQAEFRLLRADGAPCWVATHARTEREAAGRPLRMVGTLADVTALRELSSAWTEASGVAVDLHTRGLRRRRFDPALETTVYRVVQEALNNIRKHAAASRVGLIVEHRDGELRAIVEDDGRGMDADTWDQPAGPGRRLGLRGMAERARQAGGRLDLETEAGRGTTVYLSIPLQPDEET